MRAFSRRAAVVLALGLAVAAVLHTPPVKRGAGRILVSLLERRLGGAASLESFDYRLWRGEFTIEGFEWTQEETSVRAREFRVAVSPKGLVDVQAIEPDIRITLRAAAGGEAPVLPAVLLGTRVSITNGAIHVERPDDHFRLELTAIEGSLVPEGARARAAFDAGAGLVRRGDKDLDFGPAQARLVIAPAEVEIERMRIERRASFVSLTGRLGPLSPLAA